MVKSSDDNRSIITFSNYWSLSGVTYYSNFGFLESPSETTFAIYPTVNG